MLAALECVDLVIEFDEDTPGPLIETLAPDILVKGADWAEGSIVGREWVRSHGGRVVRVPLREGVSTSGILRRVAEGKSALEP